MTISKKYIERPELKLFIKKSEDGVIHIEMKMMKIKKKENVDKQTMN